MSQPDGGPAFPSTAHIEGGYAGMTLRDWFAGMALQGGLANPTLKGAVENYATDAYTYADAMLKARKAGQGDAAGS